MVVSWSPLSGHARVTSQRSIGSHGHKQAGAGTTSSVAGRGRRRRGAWCDGQLGSGSGEATRGLGSRDTMAAVSVAGSGGCDEQQRAGRGGQGQRWHGAARVWPGAGRARSHSQPGASRGCGECAQDMGEALWSCLIRLQRFYNF